MPRLPTLFISHGAPTFALEPGLAGQRLRELGRALTRPQAVLIVSPHWMTREPRVGGAMAPTTVHDFGGFAPALYDIRYPAPGDAALAQRVVAQLRQAGWDAAVEPDQGLDHGAWVPMLHMFPNADVPVVQVSMPQVLDADSAWRLGEALAPLADEGVLVVGSGSLTHNLGEVFGAGAPDADYVHAFSSWVRGVVESGDLTRLRRVMVEAPHAQRAHPTTEHLWPLLIAAGAARAPQTTTFIDGGVAHGVLAMDAVLFGAVGPG